jgi:hypothetical protein
MNYSFPLDQRLEELFQVKLNQLTDHFKLIELIIHCPFYGVIKLIPTNQK